MAYIKDKDFKAQFRLQQSIGALLGTAGGLNGSGVAAASVAPIQSGTNQGQLVGSYTNAQDAQTAQANLLAALKNQSGLGLQSAATNNQYNLGQQLAGNNAAGNQANVFSQGQNLANSLGSVNGVSNLNSALSSQKNLAQQQQNTANQYQGIANGTGPNPAMAQLNQTTGQNVANQAAMAAGQRGASQNVGLIARQAGQIGANTQQQAVGQGATMAANQELGALSGLSAQQQAIANTNQNVANIAGQQVGQQQSQQQALASQAQQQLAAQQAQQNAISGQTNTLANQQIAGTGANTSAAQNEQSILQNALAGSNSQYVGAQSGVNAANAGESNTALQGSEGLLGGAMNSAGLALGSGGGKAPAAAPSGAKGGMIKNPRKFADGGDAIPQIAQPTIQPIAPPVPIASQNGPVSSIGKFLQGFPPTGFNMGGNNGAMALQNGMTNLASGLKNYFNSPSQPQTSNFAGPDSSSQDMMAAKGGMTKKHDYRSGGNVKAKKPEEKATKQGNSYSNDKIPAVLSEGEVVIPRSIMQSKDPVRASADFVSKVLAKRKAS